MEAGESAPRWSIPRPSLSSSSGVSGVSAASVSSGGAHRSPTHSRGSPSNHSTQSASSGSLLLSAANLAQVSEHHSPTRLSPSSLSTYRHNLTAYVASTGTSLYSHSHKGSQTKINVDTGESMDLQSHSDPFWNHVKLSSAKNQRRDLKDAESVASSTHFTVVNGFTRHGRSVKNENQMWCCKKTHQITVLVVTMTVLFTAGILAAICYVEMRQRRDTGSRFS